MDLFQKCLDFTRADDIKAMGLYPYFHQISSRQNSEVMLEGQRTIMLGSNNYLGLTVDDRVIEAAKGAIDEFGTGCSGSRYLNGTLTLHVELEKRLAEFTQKEAAMTFSTGFQTNLGIISTIAGRHDVILCDKANHASIVDACRLSFAKTVRFEHNDMEDLERKLQMVGDSVGKLIVVDGVFSMEGDLADLPALVALKKKYGARLLVDDSHSLGVMGEGGRGTGEHFHLLHEVDMLMGTFSKSFASLGGFLAADERVVNFIQHLSRPFIFSASMPPSNIASVMAALDILESTPELLKTLHRNANHMREGFAKLGITIGESQAPIIPVYTYDDMRTFKVCKALLSAGVYVNPVISPAVVPGQALLRTSYMASHTLEQLDYALERFDRVLNQEFPLEA